AYRLSGEFFADPSIGSSSGMFNLATRTWSPEIIEICDMKRELFPPVLEPGTVAGHVSQGAAADTGLQAGTPVVVGGADTQLGLVGIGVVGEGTSPLSGATSGRKRWGPGRGRTDPKQSFVRPRHRFSGNGLWRPSAF